MTVTLACPPDSPSLDEALAAGVREVRSYFDLGDFGEALSLCEGLLARHPASAEALLLLGLISYELEEPQRALTVLALAHERAPDVREYADALACVNAQLGYDTEALYYAKLAAILAPHPLGGDLLPEAYGKFFHSLRSARPHLFRNRARRLLEKGDARGALAACEKQLDLTPDDAATWRLLAQAAGAVGAIARVLDACEFLRAEALSADDYDVLARALATVGDFDGAARAHANALAIEPDNPNLLNSRICTIAAQHGSRGDWLAREHAAWRAQRAAATAPRPAPRRAEPTHDRPLRIGYIGGGLHAGPLADLLAPILAAHDARQVRPYCYAANARYDVASETMASYCARWTDIHGVDPRTVAEILRGDAIDIAVDLGGHGPDSQLPVFAERPAPLCVSWLGAALPAAAPFDYLLASDALLPASGAPDAATHAVYRLPQTHLAHRPLDAPATITPLPALRQPQLTIGVMAPLAQIDAAFIGEAAEILAQVPEARLLIANVARLDDPAVTPIYELATQAGIRARVDVAELTATDPSGYGFFDYFDLLLDPQPNSRFLETCRALWMGVPVLARAGAGYWGRQAAAALCAADRAEWIFETNQARAAAVARFAAQRDELADLRGRLRQQVAATALCDVSGFARALEHAYRAIASAAAPSGHR